MSKASFGSLYDFIFSVVCLSSTMNYEMLSLFSWWFIFLPCILLLSSCSTCHGIAVSGKRVLIVEWHRICFCNLHVWIMSEVLQLLCITRGSISTATFQQTIFLTLLFVSFSLCFFRYNLVGWSFFSPIYSVRMHTPTYINTHFYNVYLQFYYVRFRWMFFTFPTSLWILQHCNRLHLKWI